jgi:hypothetical protein
MARNTAEHITAVAVAMVTVASMTIGLQHTHAILTGMHRNVTHRVHAFDNLSVSR